MFKVLETICQQNCNNNTVIFSCKIDTIKNYLKIIIQHTRLNLVTNIIFTSLGALVVGAYNHETEVEASQASPRLEKTVHPFGPFDPFAPSSWEEVEARSQWEEQE